MLVVRYQRSDCLMRYAKYIPALGFTSCVLLAGISYWVIPYRAANLPNSLYGPALAFIVLAAAITVALHMMKLGKTVALFSATLPAVVMLRIIIETASDPTSHNLWPFELIIAGALALACALPGALFGWVIAKLRGTAS